MKKIIFLFAAALAAGVAHAGPDERLNTQEAAFDDAHESAKRVAKAFGSQVRSALVCNGGNAIAFVSSLTLPRDITAIELYKLGGGFAWRHVDPHTLTDCVVSVEKLD